ncbi:MAG: protein kinase [Myxococcales bacterium]|nr:protein kinase [Myxococcales bacterium]
MFTCPRCARVFPRPGHCTDDGAPLEGGAAPSLIGQTLGSYRVERLIGRGGMGEVYLAVQPEIGARVALKLLSAESATSPTLVDRFFAEARAVNLILHESIVNVVDMARAPDGRPYLVMEYLDGHSLADLLAAHGGRLPLGQLCRIVIEVLGALTAAHSIGITHRDLKPENIFVTQAGRAKVLDFGIAKLHPDLGVSGAGTQTQAVLGTPHYMSPEQARGLPADGRSDLYSVGVILFEGATGQRPFHADSLYDLLEHQVRTPPPAPRALCPDLPPALEKVILRALEKDPARRFQSASELAQALRAIARDAPEPSMAPTTSPTDATLAAGPLPPTLSAAVVSAYPPPAHPSPAPHGRPSAWRWPLVFGLLGALGLLLAGGSFATWAVLGSRAEAGPARAAPTVIDTRRFDAIAYLPRAVEQAKQHFPDAELVVMTLPHVDDAGLIDLVATQAYVGYSFRARGPGQGNPGGEPMFAECTATVTVSHAGVVSTKSVGLCNSLYAPPPHCSARALMTRLNAKPGQRATLTYSADVTSGPMWVASFVGTNVSQIIKDDC